MFEWLIAFGSLILSPLSIFKPHISLLIVSATLTLVALAISKFFTNRQLIKEIKDRMEMIREDLTKAQKEGNTEHANKCLNEIMKANTEYLRHNFKGMIASIVVVIPFFYLLKVKYSGMVVATLPFTVPVVGSSLSWIGWYILVSFAIGWTVGKLLGD